MCDFKIGNYVEITCLGFTYSSFSKMFTLIGFNNKEVNRSWEIGEKGVIFSINKHPLSDEILLSIQHKDGRQCLIREDGVSIFLGRKPFKLKR